MTEKTGENRTLQEKITVETQDMIEKTVKNFHFNIQFTFFLN